MKTTMTKNGEELIVTLEGRLDTSTAPEFSKQLAPELDGTERLVLDFEKVDYISSSGLRALMTAYKTMLKKKGMVIRNVKEPVEEIFDITGLKNTFVLE